MKLEERYDVIPDPFLGSLRRKTLSAASSTELQDFSDPGDCAELSIESIGTCKKDNRLDLPNQMSEISLGLKRNEVSSTIHSNTVAKQCLIHLFIESTAKISSYAD